MLLGNPRPTIFLLAVAIFILQWMTSSALSSPPKPGGGKSSTLDMAMKPVVFSETPMEKTYNRLAERLRAQLPLEDGRQYWVAIAGGPGSGRH